MKLTGKVCVAIEMPGFHAWKDAPEDVRYLASRHRHLFYIRVWFRVGHDDRDVEFHQAKRRLQELLLSLYPSRYTGELELGGRSCEQIARDIALRGGRLTAGNENDVIEVEVWEDRENGASVGVQVDG